MRGWSFIISSTFVIVLNFIEIELSNVNDFEKILTEEWINYQNRRPSHSTHYLNQRLAINRIFVKNNL